MGEGEEREVTLHVSQPRRVNQREDCKVGQLERAGTGYTAATGLPQPTKLGRGGELIDEERDSPTEPLAPGITYSYIMENSSFVSIG